MIAKDLIDLVVKPARVPELESGRPAPGQPAEKFS
jgi:hypothetical protein